ncbi:carbohydrate sulfotransferase 11 [Phlebotomus argentipes]|uniref:carbohydrate sulfotransferase 11 n=1 Tax=Phlebotomus argentipes TaxID=94469 RepID=UPI002893567D|nr:carbohydrate sulfotransferase 11 [Phlebotomus argentipes]
MNQLTPHGVQRSFMKANRYQCRIVKKCFFVFATISLLPLGVVYLVSTDQVYTKLKSYDYDNETQYPALTLEHGPKSMSANEMEKLEARMQKRVERVAEVCSKYGLDKRGNDSLHRPNSWEFLINKQHRLIWCNVFKAASTSWMYNFNLMAGYSPQFLKKSKEVPLVLARKKYKRPSESELISSLNDSVSFLIVRHPFERLLSAYRDKLQNALPNSFHSKLGTTIILKYRKNKFSRVPRWPTFPEFVDYLIDTFHSHRELDMHWTPVTNFCTPCQVRFSVIAKFETLEEDQRYLIEKANIGHIVSPQWKNSGKGSKKTVALLEDFYNELSDKQVRELYRLFMYDFELFGYSIRDFYRNTTDKPSVPTTSVKSETTLRPHSSD